MRDNKILTRTAKKRHSSSEHPIGTGPHTHIITGCGEGALDLLAQLSRNAMNGIS